MASAHVVLAGLDIGFGNTKVVYSVDGGPRTEIIFRPGRPPNATLLPVQGDGTRSHLGGRTVEMILGDGTPRGSEVSTWVAGIETHKVQNYIRPHRPTSPARRNGLPCFARRSTGWMLPGWMCWSRACR